MIPAERFVTRELARYWWVPLVSGIAWLVLAWLVLRLDETSIAAVGVLIGIVFLFAALSESALGTLVMGGWKFWHYILAVIFFLGALWSFIRPVNSFFALASVLGLILIFYGTFEVIQSISLRAVNPYWWLGLISGILLLLLAFWVSGSDRVYALRQRAFLILFWVGWMALFRGFNLIVTAFAIRHAGKEAEAPVPMGA
jgi:uncharacterized membrane protein HdeD (DUF308 family)